MGVEAGARFPRSSRLGNAAIHPNDGDITKQDALDGELLAHVRATMSEILELAYEEPRARDARLAALQAAVDKVK